MIWCVVAAGCAPWTGRSETAELRSDLRGSDSLQIAVVGDDAPDDTPVGTGVADPAPADPAPATAAGITATGGPDVSPQVPVVPTSVVPTSIVPTTIVPAPPSTEPAARSSVVALSPVAARATENVFSPQMREIASQALGLIAYDWQNSLPGWELRFLDARAGYRGLTYPEERVIEVYLRSDDTPQSLAHVVAHELGHAVDVTWFDDTDRATWLSARGVDPRTPWFVADGASDFSSGTGDFAESFAWWQVGPPAWFSDLGPPPSVEQLGRLVALVLHP